MNHQTIPTLAEAKAGAKQFRARMKALGYEVSHSHALEATAAAFRFSDWATFRAAIDKQAPRAEPKAKLDLLSSVKADLIETLTPLSDRDFFTTALGLRDILATKAVGSLDNPARYFLMYPKAQTSGGGWVSNVGDTMHRAAGQHLKRILNQVIFEMAWPRLSGRAIELILSNPEFLEKIHGDRTTVKGFAAAVAQRNISVNRVLGLVDKYHVARIAVAKFSTPHEVELADLLLDCMLGLALVSGMYNMRSLVVDEIDAYFGGDHARVLTPNEARYVNPEAFDDLRWNGRHCTADILGHGYRHAVSLPKLEWEAQSRFVENLVLSGVFAGLKQAWSSYVPAVVNYHKPAPAFLLFRNEVDAQWAVGQIAGAGMADLVAVKKWDQDEQRFHGDVRVRAWDAVLAGHPLPVDD
ncbi:glyoxalase superfamily protein [Rhizobium sp. BK176]|uniref:glyoxalase superfamily protein n=1 Tax=Rhizobium sp. BK176 TaxID=2587071 RepID=UPI002168C1B5|nr:glyoxalase superfamily protein [Rhizobium sp. BK176]MCS4089690.1 hypothetical protein [Rhizobium sp. BK176]